MKGSPPCSGRREKGDNSPVEVPEACSKSSLPLLEGTCLARGDVPRTLDPEAREELSAPRLQRYECECEF